MTKQEFYEGKPFTVAGRNFRFEVIGTDGVVCEWRGGTKGDWEYYASVEIPSLQADRETGIAVWSTFFNRIVQHHLIFADLQPSTAKHLAGK
jgi:hypothetical protein